MELTAARAAALAALVDRMTLEEQVSLLSGADFWRTVAVPRLGIPQLKGADGPAGAGGGGARRAGRRRRGLRRDPRRVGDGGRGSPRPGPPGPAGRAGRGGRPGQPPDRGGAAVGRAGGHALPGRRARPAPGLAAGPGGGARDRRRPHGEGGAWRAPPAVVQAYVRDFEASVERPEKELRAFAKVHLEAGGRTAVRLELDMRSLAYFDDRRQAWCAEAGGFELLVGQSSVDLPLRARFTLVEGWREPVGPAIAPR